MNYADKINKHLELGGTVIVATYLRTWQYDKKHAGMFFMKGDNLHVKRGKSNDCLSHGKNLLVSIKLYEEI